MPDLNKAKQHRDLVLKSTGKKCTKNQKLKKQRAAT